MADAGSGRQRKGGFSMNKIITISRQFGSGGRELGCRLADQLGAAYYDQEIIIEISKRTKLSEQYIQNVMEKRPYIAYPITVAHSFSLPANDINFQMNLEIFQTQKQIIEEMAGKSDCIFVGRCADYILRDREPFRIFVYADMDSRIERCRQRASAEEHLSDREIRHNIEQIDRNRARYYSFHTDQKWGDRANYDMCLNTSRFELKQLTRMLAAFLS